MAKRNRRDWAGSSMKRDPVGTKLPLQSGYVVFIKPLPPYYKDIVNDSIPLPDYPKRKIVLAAGDVIDWLYEPKPEHEAEDHEDHELWMRWQVAHETKQKGEEIRQRARMDFLLSVCVDVLDGPNGPYEEQNDEWVQRVEAMYPGYKVPTHPGLRRLVFIKTQVVNSVDEMELILKLSTAPEVTMQGILNALQGFRDNLGQGEIGEIVANLAKEQSTTQSQVD